MSSYWAARILYESEPTRRCIYFFNPSHVPSLFFLCCILAHAFLSCSYAASPWVKACFVMAGVYNSTRQKWHIYATLQDSIILRKAISFCKRQVEQADVFNAVSSEDPSLKSRCAL
ncbi:hypothetical protein BCR43DRAFT_495937 [Syncephalastrum racemosum]|uniref:Uncharacterized protein n=1 Tax=Syncephalastrum racemosum TaxID=13706 RepID=A0A1X2H6N9_SYNRA|nr:hypothetical protein BCR43DRAFT_495937 [Syncephalastrum racemosum]